MTFEEAFEKLMGHEGGYSNNPNDTGLETMYGVTARVARENGYAGPMRDLTQAQAKGIAKRVYWDAVRGDILPDAVRFDVFDGAYNSGPSTSIKWLQRAVYVTPDGVFGPTTLMGVQTYSPQAVVARYNGHRLDAMNDMGGWASFGRGWSQRIAQNLIATKG